MKERQKYYIQLMKDFQMVDNVVRKRDILKRLSNFAFNGTCWHLLVKVNVVEFWLDIVDEQMLMKESMDVKMVLYCWNGIYNMIYHPNVQQVFYELKGIDVLKWYLLHVAAGQQMDVKNSLYGILVELIRVERFYRLVVTNDMIDMLAMDRDHLMVQLLLKEIGNYGEHYA